MNNRVMIAMSGGVDSSVAVCLLKNLGFETMGVTFLMSDVTGDCIASAEEVANKFKIEHLAVDLREEFNSFVIAEFIYSYENGLTPNPCVFCNRTMKFPKLFTAADNYNCDYAATGHYVRSEFDSNIGRYLLKKAFDPKKDQSYVLYSLNQNQLARLKFPLGELSKSQIREIARDLELSVADKPDSQDICFIPDGDYAAFISRQTSLIPPIGNYLDVDGNIIGKHKGQLNYTTGQRKGLGMSFGKHMFVISKNALDNTVTLGDEDKLFSKRVYAKNINLIATDKITVPTKLQAKIRYSQKESYAVVEQTDTNELMLIFDEPQRAVTAGQSLVIYDGDIIIGGGEIFMK